MLHQFVCNVVHGQTIIIVIDFVILDKCDPISQPKQHVNTDNEKFIFEIKRHWLFSKTKRHDLMHQISVYQNSETGAGNIWNPINIYGWQPQASYQQPPPMYMNRGPVQKCFDNMYNDELPDENERLRKSSRASSETPRIYNCFFYYIIIILCFSNAR